MDQLVAMKVFVQVVETGSFARAAERLNLSTSACSRQIADLEAHLGGRLLNRTTRKLSLTESGRAFHERSLQLLSDLEEAEQLVAQSTQVPRGLLRITCSTNFGMRQLAPALAQFMHLHPLLKFDVSLSDRIVDIVEEGFDLAVRIGAIGSQNLVARKLGESRMVVCASPGYLAARGTPKLPADLAQHNCLTYAYGPSPGQWILRDAQGQDVPVRVSGNLHANNGDMLVAAAAQGAGIAWEPSFIVGPALRAGQLVPLLTAFESPPLEIWAVYPSRRHLSAKVRVFVDFLVTRFRDAGDWTGAMAEFPTMGGS
jgi:DNA-binding transcriptional LysR family regulator